MKRVATISKEIRVTEEEYVLIERLGKAIEAKYGDDEELSKREEIKAEESIMIICMHRSKVEELAARKGTFCRPQEEHDLKQQISVLDRLRLLMSMQLDDMCREHGIPVIFK